LYEILAQCPDFSRGAGRGPLCDGVFSADPVCDAQFDGLHAGGQAVQASAEPLTLVIYADKAATREMLTRLTLLARDAGISQGWEVTLPRPLAP
jgi:hypothetical protein